VASTSHKECHEKNNEQSTPSAVTVQWQKGKNFIPQIIAAEATRNSSYFTEKHKAPRGRIHWESLLLQIHNPKNYLRSSSPWRSAATILSGPIGDVGRNE